MGTIIMSNIKLVLDTLTDAQNIIAFIDAQKGYPTANIHEGNIDDTKQKTETWDKPRLLTDGKYYVNKPDIDVSISGVSYIEEEFDFSKIPAEAE